MDKYQIKDNSGISVLDDEYWEYLLEKSKESKVIRFRKDFLKMTGNINAAIVLERIFYWHMPPKSGKKSTRLTIQRHGFKWFGVNREDWAELGLNENQFDYASRMLKKLGYICVKVTQYKKRKQLHIRLTKKFNNDYYDVIQNGKFATETKSDVGKLHDRNRTSSNFQTLPCSIYELNDILYNTKELVAIILKYTIGLWYSFSDREKYKKRIGRKAEMYYDVICNTISPIDSLQKYPSIINKYDSKIMELAESIEMGEIDDMRIQYIEKILGIEMKDKVKSRFKVIWKLLRCSDIIYDNGNDKYNIVQLLSYILVEEFKMQEVIDINAANADAYLIACISYIINNKEKIGIKCIEETA